MSPPRLLPIRKPRPIRSAQTGIDRRRGAGFEPLNPVNSVNFTHGPPDALSDFR